IKGTNPSLRAQQSNLNNNLPPTPTHQTRTFTYTLLIFTNKSPRSSAGPAQITDELYNHTQKQAKVYLIMMDAAKASEKLDIGCNFLVYFIKNSPQVFSIDNH
ncbi:hypothetical protein, partial [uncultured Planktosalinus sp.]|uniref:hypothetical protein n=1 Tax=uncultured Planktosalinus sp. TaxID=1810935 RepID=UPI0030DC45AE